MSHQKKIIIFRNAIEVDRACALIGIEEVRRFVCVAWFPGAIDGLRKWNLKFVCPTELQSDIFSETQFTARYHSLHNWCQVLDEIVQKHIAQAREIRLRMFQDKIHYIRFYFNYIHSELDKLHALEATFPNSDVHYFENSTDSDSVLHPILHLIQAQKVWKSNFRALDGQSVEESRPKKSLASVCETRVAAIVRLKKWIMREIKFQSFYDRLRPLLISDSGKEEGVILVLSEPSEDLNVALHELRSRYGFQFVFWSPDAFAFGQNADKCEVLVRILKEVSSDIRLQPWMSYRGIDLSSLYQHEVARTIDEELFRFICVVREFRKMNTNKKIKFVLSSFFHPFWEAIYDECEQLDIPHAFYLHGGTVGHFESLPMIPPYVRGENGRDEGLFYFFSYSKAIVSYLDRLKVSCPDFSAKNIAVGSPYFSSVYKLRTKVSHANPLLNKRPLKIIYVCGSFGHKGRDCQKGNYGDSSFYLLRNEFMDMLGGSSGVEILVKYLDYPNNSNLILDKKILECLWSNIKAAPKSSKFINLLGEGDLFVIEQPSTVLCEAIAATCKPVIALIDDRNLRFTPEAKKLMSKRVALVSSREELLEMIQKIKQNNFRLDGMSLGSWNDDSFCMKYLGIAETAEGVRASEVIASIIAGRSSSSAPINYEEEKVYE